MTEKIIFSKECSQYETVYKDANSLIIVQVFTYVKDLARMRPFVPVAQVLDLLGAPIDDIRYYKIGWKNPKDVRYEYVYHFENETYWIMLDGLVEI